MRTLKTAFFMLMLILVACSQVPTPLVKTILPDDPGTPLSVKIKAPSYWTAGYTLVAEAEVFGGSGPVTYAWSSSGDVDITHPRDSSTAYAYCIREGSGTISVTVTRTGAASTATHAISVK